MKANLGYITLTDKKTWAPVILNISKITDIEGIENNGTKITTSNRGEVYVREAYGDIRAAVAEWRMEN